MSQVPRNRTWQPDNLKPYTPIPSLKTLFSLFDISSLPTFSLCLPHLHNEIRDIFLSVQDNTQNEIFVFEVGGLDSLIRGYIAGNKKCAKTDKWMFITSEYILIGRIRLLHLTNKEKLLFNMIRFKSVLNCNLSFLFSSMFVLTRRHLKRGFTHL